MNVRPLSPRVFELRTTVHLCRHYECSISGFPAGAVLRVIQVKNNLCFYDFRASPAPWRSASATLRRTLLPGQRRPPQGKIGSPSSGESQQRHERTTHPTSGFVAFVKIFHTVAISVMVIIFAAGGWGGGAFERAHPSTLDFSSHPKISHFPAKSSVPRVQIPCHE